VPLLDAQVLEAARDALALARQALSRDPERRDVRDDALPELTDVDRRVGLAAAELQGDSLAADAGFARLGVELQELAHASWAEGAGGEARYWLEQAAATVLRASAQARDLAPCLEWLASPPPLEDNQQAAQQFHASLARIAKARSPQELSAAAALALAELPRLEQELLQWPDARAEACLSYVSELSTRLRATELACQLLQERAARVATDAVELADGMDFAFLYDRERSLFAIGYNVSGARLDSSHYDLLASEARLASLVAISKGDAPLEHWSKLARPRTATSAGRALLS
jgi:hypothetical protein